MEYEKKVVIGIAIIVVILSAIMIEMILDTISGPGMVYGIIVEATVIAELLVIAYLVLKRRL